MNANSLIRRAALLSLALVTVSGGIAQAADRQGDQGIGIMIGNPSGLSYNYFIDSKISLDGAFGIDQGEPDAHLTLLIHDFDILKQTPAFRDLDGDAALYFGLGPRALFADDTEVGLRFVAGISFFPRATPWEIFGEVAPVLRMTPNSGGDLDFGIGLRYYIPAIRPRS